MSLFDRFKKKKENDVRQTPVENKVEKKEAAPEKKKEKKQTITIQTKNTPMHDLWNIYQKEAKREDTFGPLEYIERTIAETMYDSEDSSDKVDGLDMELNKFVRDIQKNCEKKLQTMKQEKKNAEKSGAEVNFTPVNAEPLLYMTKNKVRLWAVIIPPLNGGEHIDMNALKFKMDSMGIKHGVDDSLVYNFVGEKMYMKIVQIAVGKEPVNGKSGSYKNLFSTDRNKINIKEDNHGNVNYKELNMIQSIHKGDVICEITHPTQAVDGVAVTGETLKGRDGKLPTIPAGRNTEYNEDKTLLIAKIDGEVVYEGGKFNVVNLLTIKEDVDNAVGNIDFTGDILIKGDVREGYTVKAEGDIHIVGTVEGATIIAGGNLIIDRGMTGGNKGKIDVQGTLKCRYLENCTVYAKEGIEVDQVIYSNLSTDQSIIFKGKKGSVTGGKLLAGHTIEAKTIGTFANTNLKTEITLGVVPHLAQREKDLVLQHQELVKRLTKMTQDIKYIQSNKSKVTEERKELLKKLLFQYQIDEVQKTKLEEELENVREEIQHNTEKCGLKSDKVYPIMILNVCGSMHTLDMELTNCQVSRKDEKTYIQSPALTELIVF